MILGKVIDKTGKIQHEATKAAILQRLSEQYDTELVRDSIRIEINEITNWIDQLKLEDTK